MPTRDERYTRVPNFGSMFDNMFRSEEFIPQDDSEPDPDPNTLGTEPEYMRCYFQSGHWVDRDAYRDWLRNCPPEDFPPILEGVDHVLRANPGELLVRCVAVPQTASAVFRRNAWAFIGRPFYLKIGGSSMHIRLTIRREEIVPGDRALAQRSLGIPLSELVLEPVRYGSLLTIQADWVARIRPDYAAGVQLLEDEEEVPEGENEEDKVKVKEMKPPPVVFGGVFDASTPVERENTRAVFVRLTQQRRASMRDPQGGGPVENVVLDLCDHTGRTIYHMGILYNNQRHGERDPFVLLSGMEQRRVPFQLDDSGGLRTVRD